MESGFEVCGWNSYRENKGSKMERDLVNLATDLRNAGCKSVTCFQPHPFQLCHVILPVILVNLKKGVCVCSVWILKFFDSEAVAFSDSTFAF